MADQPQTTGNPPKASGLVIPPEIQAQFGPLIDLIRGSESMNDEERQYWINILPIMTPDQRKNLEDILVSEKQQLAAIDAKYGRPGQAATPASNASPAETEQKLILKKREREEVEKAEQQKESGEETDILSQIQAL